MSRVIALEEGLDDIGEYLREKGLQIVSWGDYNSVVDAIVYFGHKLEDIQAAEYPSTIDSLSSDTGNGAYGVLLVNAQDKTPQEVYEIIKNRVYEHFI
ncbi:MAG: YkuS family protein [Tepidanaerobacteraceae bacterium]|nr:YkuS family protein [Tepidanaerobacteraceae bacterium]